MVAGRGFIYFLLSQDLTMHKQCCCCLVRKLQACGFMAMQHVSLRTRHSAGSKWCPFIVSVFHMFFHSSFPIIQDINLFLFAKRERRWTEHRISIYVCVVLCVCVCGMCGIEGARLTSELLEFRPYLACQEPVFAAVDGYGSAGAQTLPPVFQPAQQLHLHALSSAVFLFAPFQMW